MVFVTKEKYLICLTFPSGLKNVWFTFSFYCLQVFNKSTSTTLPYYCVLYIDKNPSLMWTTATVKQSNGRFNFVSVYSEHALFGLQSSTALHHLNLITANGEFLSVTLHAVKTLPSWPRSLAILSWFSNELKMVAVGCQYAISLLRAWLLSVSL